MSGGSMKTLWIVLAVVCFSSFLGNANIGAAVLTVLFSLLWWRARNKKSRGPKPKSPKAAKQPKAPRPAKPERVPREPKPAREPAAPKPSKNEAFVDNLALRLRTLASDFEDLTKNEILVQKNIGVRKRTSSQDVIGPGVFVIARSGLQIYFRNQNSRTGKVNEIKKSWDKILGCLPDEYRFYITELQTVELFALPKEDALFFNIAWQALSHEMNGSSVTFYDPKISEVGHALRSAARYVQANFKTGTIPDSIDLESIVEDRPMDDEVVIVPRPAAERFTTEPKPGDVVGGYKLGASLGGGAYGEVYKSVRRKDDFVAAVKIMKVDKAVAFGSVAFNRASQDFLDEAKMSSNFPHDPFILTPIDYGVSPWPWIAYPLLQGKTVDKTLPLSQSKWWNLAHDVLSGLNDAHQSGVVHADVKLNNVMDVGDQYKILDFGMSYIPGYVRTQASKGLGTTTFWAPEILETYARNGEFDKLTPDIDIFSVGVMLHVSRTGEFPYQRTNGPIEAEIEGRKHIQIRTDLFDEEQVHLLKRLLDVDPKSRISAHDALKIVGPHVDVEAKTLLWEEALLATYKDKAAEEIQNQESSGQYELEGPFSSWSEFEKLLLDTLESKRPRYFTINFSDHKSKHIFYVQAYFDKTGWHLECAGEKFLPKKIQTPEQKQALIDLGWLPPTKDVPNYNRDSESVSPADATALFVDAIERGYGFRPIDFAKFDLNTQGEGHY